MDQDSKTFEEARFKELFSKIYSTVLGSQDELLSLTEVSSLVKPSSETYQGVRTVPISQIVGSEGRYRDFNKRFFPRHSHLKFRWERINQAYKKGIPLPPVKLYELGGVYFVRDGNHRVSVALMRGIEYIDAEVTSLETDIELHEDMTMEELTRAVIGYEKRKFCEETQLDTLRPGADISFTAPGRYDAAIEHIHGHKYYLNLDKKFEIPFTDAVVSWHDTVYLPMIKLIEEENILARFPDRTVADMYIWIIRYWDDLKRKYGNQYSRKKAVLKFSELFGKSFWQILKGRIKTLFLGKTGK